ncbi:hypothetical protein [Actinokineospora sp. NPDC004072]
MIPTASDHSPDGLRTDSIQVGENKQIALMLKQGSDGSLWVTVEGVDSRQLAEKIEEACEALIIRKPKKSA